MGITAGIFPTSIPMTIKKLPLGLFQLGLCIFYLIFYYFTQAIDSWAMVGLTLMELVLLIIGGSIYLACGGPGQLGHRYQKQDLALALLVPLLIYPILLLCNGLFLSLLSKFIDLEDASAGFVGNGMGLSVYFFYGLLPAICEEAFFRGGLFSYYRQFDERYSLWMTSLLFALFHFHIQNFVVPFLLGLGLGLLVLRTGKVMYAMIGHFVANTAGILFRRSLSTENIAWLRSLGLVQAIGSFEKTLILVLVLASILSMVVLKLWLGRQVRMERVVGRGNREVLLFGSLPLLVVVVFYCVKVF